MNNRQIFIRHTRARCECQMIVAMSVVVLLALTNLGCEELPRLSSSAVTSTASANVVTDQGRGEYDWQRDGTPFVFKRKLPFSYFERVEPKLLAEKMNAKRIEIDFDKQDFSRLQPDLVANLKRAFTRNPKIEIKYEIPKSKEVVTSGFHFDQAGERLITVGSRVQIWDVGSGKATASFPSPGECKSAFLMKSAQQCLVVKSQAVAIHDIGSGSQLYIMEFTDPIEFCTYSEKANTIALVTRAKEGLQLHVMNDHCKTLSRTKEGEIVDARVSINPEGKYIAVSQNKLARWHIDKQPAELVVQNTRTLKDTIALAGVESDYWFGENGAVQLTSPVQDPSRYVSLISRILDAKAFTLENYTWALVLGKRIGQDRNWQSFLQDIHINRFEISIPQDLAHPASCMDAAKDGTLVALGCEHAIQVADRVRFTDPYFDLTIGRIASLLIKDRFDEFEAAVKFIRAQPRVIASDCGEELYAKILRGAAVRWKESIRISGTFPQVQGMMVSGFSNATELSDDPLKKFQKWLDSESPIAKETYAATLYELSTEPRFRYLTPECIRLFDELLKGERPSAMVFELRILLENRNSILTAEQLDPLLESATSLYPSTLDHHTAVASLFGKSDYILDEVDADAYMNAVADMYPVETNDAVYALLVARFLDRVSIPNMPLDQDRLVRGIRIAIEQDWLYPSDAYQWYSHFVTKYRNENQAEMDRIPNYFIRNQTIVDSFTGPARTEFFEKVRDQAFSLAK